jgi:hypothetical protein
MTAPTYVTPIAGEKIWLEVETTPGSGVFGSPMSVTLTRNLKLTTVSDTTLIPQITNPSGPGYQQTIVTGTDWSFDGGGTTNLGEDYTYAQWWQSGAPRNVRVSALNTGGLVLTGAASLTDLSPFDSGGIGKVAQFSVSLKAAGPATIAAHA